MKQLKTIIYNIPIIYNNFSTIFSHKVKTNRFVPTSGIPNSN